MQQQVFRRIVLALIVATSVGTGACSGGSSSAVSDAEASSARTPAGTYESRLPDGTAIELRFRDGGDVVIAMTEDGATNTQDGKWVVNGQVILVEGGEGMVIQLSWRGDALVSDFGGATLTFVQS